MGISIERLITFSPEFEPQVLEKKRVNNLGAPYRAQSRRSHEPLRQIPSFRPPPPFARYIHESVWKAEAAALAE